MICKTFTMLAALLASAQLLANEGKNLVPNPGFELNTQSWTANGWGGAKADFGRIDSPDGRYFSFKRLNGDGGLQLLSPPLPLEGQGERLSLKFRYKGAAHVGLRLLHWENGAWAPLKNPLGTQAHLGARELKPTLKWTTQEVPLRLSGLPAGERLAACVQFVIWGSTPEFSVDDVELRGVAPAPVPAAPKDGEWLKIFPTRDLSSTEASWYSPNPTPNFQYGQGDGMLKRNGKPWFYLGNQTIGAGQGAVVSSLWLSRLLKNSYSTLDWGMGAFDIKANQGALEIHGWDAAPRYSALREVERQGLLGALDCGNAYYVFNPLRNWTEKFPKLSEFFVEGSHFYCYDHNTPLGREMYFNAWKDFFRYFRETPLLSFESFNELGYTPSHRRVLEGFRQFAQAKHGTLAEANRRWGKNFKSWDEVMPPHLAAGARAMSFSEKLSYLKTCREQPLYYDWLIFLQHDLMPGIREMKKDFRRLSDAPFCVDWRGHESETDGYCAIDLELLDEVVDIYYLHTECPLFDYGGQAADQASVLNALTRTALAHDYVRDNSAKPVLNPESIYSLTSSSGSNLEAMEKNSLGKFQGQWRFTLETDTQGVERGYFKPGFDDSAWGHMNVPGCWDATEQYKGRKGWGWYRTRFTIPGGLKLSYLDGSTRYLVVGKGVAQRGTLWLNGQKVGEPVGWDAEYKYDVSALLNYGGENTVAFLVDGSNYNNGLRFYFHVLADNMVSNSRFLEKREWATILWTTLAHGGSGITLWNWGETLLLYMPELITELNSVSAVTLPAARHPDAKVALLMPWQYFHGLPWPRFKNHLDYMSYFGALTFNQTPADVLGERKFAQITPESHPFAVVPYAKIVRPEVFDNFRKYVEAGGFAVVTFDSLKTDFQRYAPLPVEEFAGVELSGDVDSPVTLCFDGKDFPLAKGDRCGKYGVRVKPGSDSKVIATYSDGSPAITSRQRGKGTVCYVAARLDLTAAHAVLGSLMARQGVEPFPRLVSDNKTEFPYVETKVLGSPERFVLYLQNWGGQAHGLTISVAAPAFLKHGYRMRNVRAQATPARTVSAAELRDGIKVRAESMDPVALLFEAEGTKPMALEKVSPRRQAALDHVAALNRDDALDTSRPNVLFMAPIETNGGGRVSVGREFYPLVADFARRTGCGVRSLPWAEFTPENLKQYQMVFLGEDVCYGYRTALKAKDSRLLDNLLNYVRGGGSLVLVSASGLDNTTHDMSSAVGEKLGFGFTSICRNPASCGYGDPLQLKIKNFTNHPLSKNMKALQLFTCPALRLGKNCPLVPVALTGKDDLKNPTAPVVAAGQVGAGRVVVATDAMWLQPFRAEDDDNAQFLANVVDWCLGREPKAYDHSALEGQLFLTNRLMEEAEKAEGLR